MPEGSSTSIGNLYAPTVVGQEFLRWVNDPTEFYIWMEHTLRGEVLTVNDNGKEKWELPDLLEEQMTREASINIVNKLRPYLNPFTFHADYKDEEIPDMVLPIATEIDIYLKRNQKAFKIKDENISMIAVGIKTLVFTAFKMSKMRKFYEAVMKIGLGTVTEKEKGKLFGIFPSSKGGSSQ